MTTQSVMATGTAELSGSVRDGAAQKKNRAGNAFDLLFSGNLQADKTALGSTDHVSTAKKTANADNNSNNPKDNAVKDEKTGTAASKAAQTGRTANASSKAAARPAGSGKAAGKAGMDAKQVTDLPEEETEPTDEQLASLMELLDNIRELLMQLLNLTPEQFDQLTDKLQAENGDFDKVQLLQPDMISRMVLLNSGTADPLAVLTDENLADTMKQVLDAAEELKSDSGLTLTQEQIKKLLEQMKAQQESQAADLADSQKAGDKLPAQNAAKGQAQSAQAIKEPLTQDTSLKEASLGTANPVRTGEQTAGEQNDTGRHEDQSFDGASPFQAFTEKMVQATQNLQQDFSGELVQITNLKEIVNRMVERIKVMSEPGQTSLQLQLNPEELGRVNLTVQSKNGVMTAQFTVQNDISKEALEGQMQSLRDTLEQQGIKIESIEVTVEAYAFNENAPEDQNGHAKENEGTSGRKITLEEALSMSEAADEQNYSPDSDGLRGSLIDATA